MTKEEFLAKMSTRWDKLKSLEQSVDLYELEKGFDQVWTETGLEILNGVIGEAKTKDRRKKKDKK